MFVFWSVANLFPKFPFVQQAIFEITACLFIRHVCRWHIHSGIGQVDNIFSLTVIVIGMVMRKWYPMCNQLVTIVIYFHFFFRAILLTTLSLYIHTRISSFDHPVYILLSNSQGHSVCYYSWQKTMVTEIQLFWFPELDLSASVFPPPSFANYLLQRCRFTCFTNSRRNSIMNSI